MPKIKFIKENTTIEVEPGANLRKVALKNGIPVYSGVHKFVNCMGNSLCGSCSVLIKKGIENCSPKGVMEKFAFKTSLAAFTSIGHEDEMRLSCQTQVNGDIEVESTPGLNWHGERFWG